MNSSMTTILHTETAFANKDIYLTGQSFVRCSFRSCTLVIKDLSMLGLFEQCSFENCIWYINATISDRDSWQTFLDNVAPAMTEILPKKTDGAEPTDR